jgi:hypothetical protein
MKRTLGHKKLPNIPIVKHRLTISSAHSHQEPGNGQTRDQGHELDFLLKRSHSPPASSKLKIAYITLLQFALPKSMVVISNGFHYVAHNSQQNKKLPHEASHRHQQQ